MNDLSKFGIAAGLGGIGAGLGSLLGGGGGDAYGAASKYLNKIPGQVAPYYNPYLQAGQQSLGQLQGQYGQLLGNLPQLQGTFGQLSGLAPGLLGQYGQLTNDPTAMINKIGSQYQSSPGYEFQKNQALGAAGNAAAAGGLAGSPQHQQQAAQLASNLANQDYWNFVNQGLNQYGIGLQGQTGLFGTGLQGQQGLYGAGLQGLQGLNQMGFGASDQMARILADLASQKGQLSFAQQAAQNQSQGTGWGNLLGGLGSLIGFL